VKTRDRRREDLELIETLLALAVFGVAYYTRKTYRALMGKPSTEPMW
jgi:hypothetical protein